jgi:hypothetical protein
MTRAMTRTVGALGPGIQPLPQALGLLRVPLTRRNGTCQPRKLAKKSRGNLTNAGIKPNLWSIEYLMLVPTRRAGGRPVEDLSTGASQPGSRSLSEPILSGDSD